ncbi:uncharacterized protein LOC135472753 [Liolophura sinensis]|uniref:uncharacterized protein LOC135472753 n=1 Tax=Liolophura sinensis TaxID=3198878 RepID=UPI003159554F
MESFSSSYHHNKSINGAPLGRIVMMGPKILYGKREYSSASEALEDYICEFEGSGRKLKFSYSQRSKKDVLDLLTTGLSPSVYDGTRRVNGVSEDDTRGSVPQDPNRSAMSLGNRLSLRDLQSSSTLTGNLSRLDISRASIEESFRRMKEVDDAFKVAHTLNQSHDVLRKVEEDRLSDIGESPSRCDMRSLATESLISVNPYPFSNGVPEVTAVPQNPEPQRRGHIYSYRTPRSRSHTVSGVNFTQANNKFVGETNGAFKNEAAFGSTSYGATRPHSGQGRQLSADKQLFPTSRYRSRSASPNVDRSKYNPKTGSRQAPSWLEDLDSSRDSRLSAAENPRAPSGARRTPSWIEDIVGSTASSVTDIKHVPVSSDNLSVGSGCSTVNDSKSSSSCMAPVLYVSDLNIGAGSEVRQAEKRRPASAQIHTSTPSKPRGARNDVSAKIGLANGLPDRFRIPSDSLDGKTVSSISFSNARLARSLDNTTDLRVNCAENEDRIGKMLKELDVIKTKLKSSSEDATSCLREITIDQRADNFTETPEISSSQEPGKADRRLLDKDSPAVSSYLQGNEQDPHMLAVSHDPCSSPSSGVTDEILQGDRPWERAPVSVMKSSFGDGDTRVCGASRPGVIGDFLNDCLNEKNKQATQTSSHDTPNARSLEDLKSEETPRSLEAFQTLGQGSQHRSLDALKVLSRESQQGFTDAMKISSGESQRGSRDAVKILSGESQQRSTDAVKVLIGGSTDGAKIPSKESVQESPDAGKITSRESQQCSMDSIKILSGGSQLGSMDAVKILSGGSESRSREALKTVASHPEATEAQKTLSGGSQPGSMEALKNMLFRLQSEASTTQQEGYEERDMAVRCRDLAVQCIQIDDVDDVIDPDRLSVADDFNTGPGAECLERALVHLSRLKTLVQSSAFNPEPRNKSTFNALPSNP